MLSKKVGVTINDVITCAISKAMNTILHQKGDTEQKEIYMVIPANIRFKFYKTREEIKMENKFSALPFKVPLVDNMSSSYGLIQSVTNKLKTSIPLVYASYSATTFFAKLFWRFAIKQVLMQESSKFTLAFSNTPGPVKNFFYWDYEKKVKMKMLDTKGAFIAAGNIGINVLSLSFSEVFFVSVTADDGIMDKATTKELVRQIESNIEEEITRTKDMPMPEDKKKK